MFLPHYCPHLCHLTNPSQLTHPCSHQHLTNVHHTNTSQLTHKLYHTSASQLTHQYQCYTNTSTTPMPVPAPLPAHQCSAKAAVSTHVSPTQCHQHPCPPGVTRGRAYINPIRFVRRRKSSCPARKRTNELVGITVHSYLLIHLLRSFAHCLGNMLLCSQFLLWHRAG
jgi:hypothetical protein